MAIVYPFCRLLIYVLRNLSNGETRINLVRYKNEDWRSLSYLGLGTALCHFWVDLAIRGSEAGREQEQEQEEQPAADNTLHKQLLTASPNWFRTLFLRRRRRTNRTERRQETMPGIQ